MQPTSDLHICMSRTVYDCRFHHQKEDTNGIAKLLSDPTLCSAHGVVYLENSGYEDPVTGLKFWGSPNQKWFGTWAFANIDAAAAQKVRAERTCFMQAF